MNESLQQALAGILNKTMAGVEAGVSFLSAELPDVIQQLLVWKLAQSPVLLALGVSFLVLSAYLLRKGLKNMKEEGVKTWTNRQEHRYVAPYIISAFAVSIGFVMSMVNGATALQIWLAPKIYLIEYAASLAK